MLQSGALSLPTTFAHEHRPLRLTSENARPQPAGECQYVLLHPPAQGQRCSCQSFHHNRSAPGNICECGHQACYHVHEMKNDKHPDPLHAVVEKFGIMFDKVRRLEETIQNERANRETALQRERQMWEREVRILREALAPFYHSEKEMRRKLIDLEDKVEGHFDEQVRLRDRILAVDDVTMSMEKRVEELEGLRSKRRRVGRIQNPEEPPQVGYISPDPATVRRVSSSIDERSVHTPSSRALSPNGAASSAPSEAEEPRSSGILNLVAEPPRPIPFSTLPPRLSPPQEEPRSSGFLTLEMPKRQIHQAASDQAARIALHQAARITPPQDRPSPTSSATSNVDGSQAARTPPESISTKLPVIDVMVLPVNTSPRKRKHNLTHLALDVLADVTVASPLIHG